MAETAPTEAQRLVAEVNALLRLKTTIIGMQLFETVAEMEAIPRIRRPKTRHTTDQIVSMGSRLGWTVGITQEDLVGAQCGAVIGLAPRDEDFLRGERYVNVWHGTQPDAQARQEALTCVPLAATRRWPSARWRAAGCRRRRSAWSMRPLAR